MQNKNRTYLKNKNTETKSKRLDKKLYINIIGLLNFGIANILLVHIISHLHTQNVSLTDDLIILF